MNENKYNKDATTAIEQIKRQEYVYSLQHYIGDVILVGINYDKRGLRASDTRRPLFIVLTLRLVTVRNRPSP